jgi:NADPH:quinone reductase-like Zn-dependent oxidoreductase
MRAMKIAARYRPIIRAYAGLLRPTRLTILGQELAGEVEAVGKTVTRFKPGDAVFAPTFFRMGAYAEYACLPESYPVLKPGNLTYDEAATIPTGGINGLHLARAANVHPGQRVLIIGAGGSIGTYAAQIAKSFGAEVTAVDNAGKLDFLRALGADHVIDYAREDFTKTGKQYDMILDLIAHRPAFAYLRALKPNGRYYFVGGSVGTLFQILLLGPLMSWGTGKHVRLLAVQPNRKDLEHITALCASGEIKIAIDKRFSLEEVPQALRYLGEGRAKGKVVVVVG